MIARLAYAGVIALATLSQLGFEQVSATDLHGRLLRAVAPTLTARDVVDALRNLLLFAGWGLVWCLTAPTDRLRREIIPATVTGMLLSMVVETAQLFSAARQASIMDVLTNTGGALMGAIGAVALLQAALAARGSRSFVGMPMFVFAAGYGGAALLEIVLPGLRQELIPDNWGGPLARLQTALSQLGEHRPPAPTLLLQLVLMVPAGGFAVAALIEHGRSYGRARLEVAVAGVLLSLLLELTRGVTGQPIEPAVFLAHAAGFVIGAWLAARWLPALTRTLRGQQRPLALLAFYCALLLLWRWRPFALHLDPALIHEAFALTRLVPLESLTMKMDLFSAAIVAVGFLLHLPVGALLAVWPLRRSGWLAHVLPGIWIVIAIEAGQILVEGRYFDVTDMLIGGAGVLAGWAVLRRAGYHPHGYALVP